MVKGVVMYERMAKCKSSPHSMALVRLFLIVCTQCSAWPLDCALVGDVTVLYFQVLMKLWDSCKVNCVSPSETMHLGTPISVKIFRCLVTLIEWRLQFSDNWELIEIIDC